MADRNIFVLLSGPLLALACSAACWMSFRVNTWITPWVEYAPGASLIFLPAGVKLLALLTTGGWGVLGLGVAALHVAAEVWTDAGMAALLGNVIVWLGVPYLLIEGLLRALGVNRDLSNLSITPLLLIAVTVAVVGGAANSAYAVLVHGRRSEELLSTALAMAFGDFLGQGLLLSLMMAMLALTQRKRRA